LSAWLFLPMTCIHMLTFLDMRSSLPFATSCFCVSYLCSWWLPQVLLSPSYMAAGYNSSAPCTTISLEEKMQPQVFNTLAGSDPPIRRYAPPQPRLAYRWSLSKAHSLASVNSGAASMDRELNHDTHKQWRPISGLLVHFNVRD
jgi:hypothetical protein